MYLPTIRSMAEDRQRPTLGAVLLWLMLCGLSTTGLAAEGGTEGQTWFTEGLQYERIARPVPTHVAPGKVEVVELFWYGCPHCYHFEPYLSKWMVNKPKAAEFRRIPAALNPSWQAMAKTYYALELMGEAERLHPIIFQAIHEQGRKLRDLDAIARFLAQQGVDEKRFREAYASLPVQTRMQEAAYLGRDYGVRGVPAVVVNGKYRTSASLAGGYDEVLEVVNFLVEKESRETPP